MGFEEVERCLRVQMLTPETENSLDRLFSALDGKPTDGAPARILGIHDDGREWWIQVARGDDVINTIVLRVSRFASVTSCRGGADRMELIGERARRGSSARCVSSRSERDR